MRNGNQQESPDGLIVCINGPRPERNVYRDPEERFSLVSEDPSILERLLTADAYSVAKAFVEGQVTVRGDLFAAVRFFRNRKPSFLRQWWFKVAGSLRTATTGWLGGKHTSRSNILFHYDRSNEFYQQFLDSHMLYSAAHFTNRETSLEDAQVNKLEQICKALDLRPGQRLLDIGCGWGALIIYAAERFGVDAVGCTLSRNQFQYARDAVRARGLVRRVSILERDYRDLKGSFDKIASVGMFEHVGRSHLAEYFRKVHALLEDDGRFLNRGIVRPETVSDDAETLFLQKSVFPGGELLHLADTVRQAERAGFSVLEMEDLRPDYALTCRAWVTRLLENAEYCLHLVGRETYRTWLLYLAASALSFEDGQSDAAQLTFKRVVLQ